MATVKWKVAPARPIDVEMRLNSPLLVDAEVYVRQPGAVKWQRVYKSEIGEDVPGGHVALTLDPLPAGSRLLLAAFFFGAKKTQFRAEFRVAQQGGEHPAAEIPPITDSTKGRNAAGVEVEVELT